MAAPQLNRNPLGGGATTPEMTLFEHLSIAVSLIFSFGVVRVLGGFSYASSAQNRYWPHLLWLFVYSLAAAVAWWHFWSFEAVDWTFLSFLLYLAFCCTYYLMAAALVPASPDRVTDWRAYFFSIRRRAFLTAAFSQVVFSACTLQLLGLPLFAPRRIWAVVNIGLCLSGAFVKNPRFHAALPVVVLLAFTAGTILFSLRPGTAGSP